MSIAIGNWDTGIYRPDFNISKRKERVNLLINAENRSKKSILQHKYNFGSVRELTHTYIFI